MAPSPERRDQGATIAGRYSIRRKLGSGSLGTVFLAHDAVRRHPVALKVIRTDRMNPEAVRDMQRELSSDPTAESRNMTTLRPNRFTERELRLFGKYEVFGT